MSLSESESGRGVSVWGIRGGAAIGASGAMDGGGGGGGRLDSFRWSGYAGKIKCK